MPPIRGLQIRDELVQLSNVLLDRGHRVLERRKLLLGPQLVRHVLRTLVAFPLLPRIISRIRGDSVHQLRILGVHHNRRVGLTFLRRSHVVAAGNRFPQSLRRQVHLHLVAPQRVAVSGERLGLELGAIIVLGTHNIHVIDASGGVDSRGLGRDCKTKSKV